MSSKVQLVRWDEPAPLDVVWRRAGDSLKETIDAVDRNPGVGWLHLDTVGVDRLPLRRWAERGIRVTNGRGLTTTQVAEWTLAALMFAVRRLDVSMSLTRERNWSPPYAPLHTLLDSRLTIVGLGRIGMRVAELAVVFGAHVNGVTRSPVSPSDPRLTTIPRILPTTALNEALEGADLVALCAPATPASASLISAGALAQLRPGAWVVNAARGELIDESALVDALESGQLGGAVLDVVSGERPDADSALWGRSNVLLTGHSADFPRPSPRVATDLFADELQRFLSGERFTNEVNLEQGY